MKLLKMEIVPRRIPLAVPYRIAGRAFDGAEIVCVTLRDDSGAAGFGSGSPVPPLTGDDLDGATRALERDIRPVLLGTDISDLEEAIARAWVAAPSGRSALAAVDIALHDLQARRRGVPLVTMLGGARRRLVTSVTVGIDEPERMVSAARRHLARGFRILKVKIGDDVELDRRRLERIREAVGPRIAIRVDANEGYGIDDAVGIARCLEDLDVELIEQPVAAADVEGMAAVRRVAGVPVVADEAVRVAADLEPLVAARAADGANIKLMKCGGIREARRLDRALSGAGWASLIGCMDESRAGIAAAAHFAAAGESVAWIDLDGHLDLADDPFSGGFEIVGGEIELGDAPGLGVAAASTR